LWELASGECTRALATAAICRDADPAFALTAEPELARVLDGDRIREFACFDSVSWKHLAVYAGHTEEVRAATFVSVDRIVSISGDSTARLWDAWSGERLRTLYTNPLYALADDPSRGRLGGSISEEKFGEVQFERVELEPLDILLLLTANGFEATEGCQAVALHAAGSPDTICQKLLDRPESQRRPDRSVTVVVCTRLFP